jgi:hypothetical protein
MKRTVIITTVIIILNSVFLSQVFAQPKVKSDNYVIQLPNFNSGAGIPTSPSFKLKGTFGQTAPGLFSSTNYRVRSGFEYIHTIIPFSFSVSNISINFGDLTANTPVTRTSTLTVKAGGAGGYSVKAYETHPLAIDNNPAKAKIIDTLCDSGPCSESSAGPWTLGTTYGFGLNMAGDDVPADFSGGKYRQFADNYSSEIPQSIMSKTNVTWDYPNNAWPWESEATITYKVNIGGTQEAGTYQNSIIFIAVPSF